MKYTIEGFSQRVAVDLGLDSTDLLILRWIVDFSHTGKMVKMQVNDKTYLWVKYDAIMQDLPIIGFKTKDALYRRLKKMVECEVLEHTVVKQAGVFSMYKMGKLYDRLLSDENRGGSVLKPNVSDEKPNETDEKSEQNINLLNKSTKIKDNVDQSSTIPFSEIINYLNTKADTNYKASSKDTQKHIKARYSEGFSIDDFKKVIDVKVAEWKKDTKMCGYLRPSTLFGSKFESYLNQPVTKWSGAKTVRHDPEKDEVATDREGNPIVF